MRWKNRNPEPVEIWLELGENGRIVCASYDEFTEHYKRHHTILKMREVQDSEKLTEGGK